MFCISLYPLTQARNFAARHQEDWINVLALASPENKYIASSSRHNRPARCKPELPITNSSSSRTTCSAGRHSTYSPLPIRNMHRTLDMANGSRLSLRQQHRPARMHPVTLQWRLPQWLLRSPGWLHPRPWMERSACYLLNPVMSGIAAKHQAILPWYEMTSFLLLGRSLEAAPYRQRREMVLACALLAAHLTQARGGGFDDSTRRV